MIIHGFELIKEEKIPKLNNTNARLFRHIETGAELLSMENDDENKSFGITFRTPVNDSTGVPHILEHSVLGGSQKYPVKDPFVHLTQGSLNTFINAFTFPDKTCYPAASQNLKDFYNLIDVYLDAVLYPNIKPETLQQEGWHYELENLDAPLTYKGVVLNEMKGTYSSPEQIFGDVIQRNLFPDTTYQFDSGGNPKHITDLTYEQFKSYHETYYHPSNARIYFYGDDPPEARLRIIQNYLKDFSKIEPDSKITLQPYFDAPRRVTHAYPAGRETDPEKKYRIAVNWLLPEATDPELTMALSIMSDLLTGTSASPLRKALIDSGLGDALTGSGLSTHLRQMFFSVGLKGVHRDNVDEVETLIFDTLDILAKEGFESEMIEAAVNTIEFHLREKNTGSFPRGLAVMLGVLNTWLHDGDPFSHLKYEKPLNALKTNLAGEERVFENLIERYFINNPHRVTVILEPDTELPQREEAQEREQLAEIRKQKSQEDLKMVMQKAQQLKELQETPDSPEALATLPMLQLSDLDKKIKHIPLEVIQEGKTKILYHDLLTDGIIYLDVGFNLHTLPQELLPYMPLFSTALTQIGTETEDFVKLSQRIGRKTGGVLASPLILPMRNSQKSTAWLFLRGKATTDKGDDLLDIMRDILLTIKLDNPERFMQLLLREKAGEESNIVSYGSATVATRLQARFHEASWANEQMNGISYLFFLRQLVKDVKDDWQSVLAKLEEIRRIVFNQNGMISNITLDEANWQKFQPKLAHLFTDMPTHPVNIAEWKCGMLPKYEGLTAPATVNYVCKGANLYDFGYKRHGSVSVILNHLRSTWLWEKIRVQGGAYGTFCNFGDLSGVLTYTSYHDPNLLKTLDAYDKSGQFLRELDLSNDDLTKNIIGVIGSMDGYQLPDGKGRTSMIRHLVGNTEEHIQQIRDEVLTTTIEDFKRFADALDYVKQEGCVVILSSKENIEALNERSNDWLEVTKVL